MGFIEPNTIIATISAIIAVVALLTVRRTHQQRNTLSFINDYNDDKRVSAGIAVFLSVYKGENPASYILKKDNRKDYDNFLVLMNKLEILAIGLNHNIYDKKMIKDCFSYDLFITYTQSKPLIDIIRNKDSKTTGKGDMAFEKFENLAIDIGADYKK